MKYTTVGIVYSVTFHAQWRIFYDIKRVLKVYM